MNCLRVSAEVHFDRIERERFPPCVSVHGGPLAGIQVSKRPTHNRTRIRSRKELHPYGKQSRRGCPHRVAVRKGVTLRAHYTGQLRGTLRRGRGPSAPKKAKDSDE